MVLMHEVADSTRPPREPAKPGTAFRRWLPFAALILAGAVVFLPALRSRYLLDDYLHMAMIEGTFPAHRGPADLYDFVNDGERDMLVEHGMLPWWTHPKLTVRFFRPLS